MSTPRQESLVIPSIFRLTSRAWRVNCPPWNDVIPRTKLIRFGQLTHQSERTTLLAQSVLLSMRTEMPYKQGEQFASAGDLVTARILFQRAAEAGDATAAMALGATYDPNALAKLGVVGMGADVEQARSWYRKAESFGSPEASRRLNALANR